MKPNPMKQIKEADEAEKQYIKVTRSPVHYNAVSRWRKRTGKSAVTVEHKGAAYVLFLERIIKGEGK